MFCKNCGRQLPDGSKFCSQCGANQESINTYTTYTQSREPKPSVSILEAVKLYFAGYVNFSGRSRRSEYWWACLVIALISGIAANISPEVSNVWALATLLPSVAVAIRRLHDIGKSGWWYLLNLIPVVGQIILVVWYCRDSAGANQWGASPKY